MFEVTEEINISDFDFKTVRILESTKDSVASITSEVRELIFGNIRITSDSEGDVLIIEEINADDKAASFESTRRKVLTVVSSGPKTRPGDPAGTRSKPKIIIRPRR